MDDFKEIYNSITLSEKEIKELKDAQYKKLNKFQKFIVSGKLLPGGLILFSGIIFSLFLYGLIIDPSIKDNLFYRLVTLFFITFPAISSITQMHFRDKFMNISSYRSEKDAMLKLSKFETHTLEEFLKTQQMPDYSRKLILKHLESRSLESISVLNELNNLIPGQDIKYQKI